MKIGLYAIERDGRIEVSINQVDTRRPNMDDSIDIRYLAGLGALELDVDDIRRAADYVGDTILANGAKPTEIKNDRRWIFVYNSSDRRKVLNDDLFWFIAPKVDSGATE